MQQKKHSQIRWSSLYLLVLVLVLMDQTLKIWVKLNFQLGEEMPLFGLNWAVIRLVENEGMAFGWMLGGEWGKALLTFIRISAVLFILYTIKYFRRTGASFYLILFLLIILAGAIGNTIDSIFYGRLFSTSPFHGGLAVWLPGEGGYAPLFQGRVVDMLYFPLLETNWPEWLPWIGGRDFKIFEAVFNLADLYVVTGIAGVLITGRKTLFRIKS
ncbi:MAG: lipoprotein signal peptidase [Saprospirales bacterium]|nr:MAG: lipoprotein signal peptidase [Saprospirales bacterium]